MTENIDITTVEIKHLKELMMEIKLRLREIEKCRANDREDCRKEFFGIINAINDKLTEYKTKFNGSTPIQKSFQDMVSQLAVDVATISFRVEALEKHKSKSEDKLWGIVKPIIIAVLSGLITLAAYIRILGG